MPDQLIRAAMLSVVSVGISREPQEWLNATYWAFGTVVILMTWMQFGANNFKIRLGKVSEEYLGDWATPTFALAFSQL